MTSPIGAITSAPATGSKDAEKLKDAAHQFEAMLLSQMMRSMRESGSGWMGTGDDQSSASVMEMAEEQFAQAMAATGGLGLATIVTQHLEPKAHPE